MSYKNTVDLFRGLLSDIEDDDAKALRLGLQPPVMAQQQVPQVQIPMAPPAPQQFIPEIQIPPPVDVGQIEMPQPLVGSMVNRGSARAGLDGRQAQFEADQRSKDFGVVGGPYNYLIPGEETLKGFPTEPGRDTTYADLIGKPYDYETDLGLNNPLYVPPTGGYTPKPTSLSQEEASEDGFNVLDLFKGNVGSRSQSDILTNESFLQPDQDIEGLKTRQAEEDAADREDLVSGKLSVTQYERNKSKREAELRDSQEKQTISERQTLGILTSRANKLEAAGLKEEANQVRSQIPKPEGSGIPKAEQELLDGEPAVDLTPTQPAVTTTQPAATGGSNLTQQDAVEAETTITAPVKTDADALVKGAGTAPKKDAPPEEKEGFLKKLWGGMKDMFKEGMEDPAFRKTLFAYVGSKALGYDGVTFAGQVLENEWKVQAAERKQEFELEKIYGKEGLATIKAEKKAKTIDPSKVATIYDKETETNLTGAFSADGTMVRLDDASFYESLGIEPDANGVYPVLPVANVRAAQGGKRFSVGVGLTGNDIISGIRDNIDLDVDNAINTYVSNQGLESAEEKQLTAKLNDAINGTVRNGAARAFKSFYPAGTDFSDFNLQEISTNAVQKYIQSVAKGMEGNSKNLAAFMEKERLKVETEYSVSPSFFKVVGDDSEDAIGGEAWSKATAKVKYLASAFGKEIGANKAVPKVAMWSNLERLYNKQSEEMGPEFKKFWESESKDSADKKGQGASPALLWVMSMDRDKSATSSKYFAGSMQDVINKMK